MGGSKSSRAVHGILLMDKPAGITSNKALQISKRLFNANKAGHTGSLDPFATGLLPICFGEATKISAFLLESDKRYRAVARLGEQTNTGDRDGNIIASEAVPMLRAEQIQASMHEMCGDIEQVPPMYSAIKQDGIPLYKLARAGKQVERPPRSITIYEFNCLDWQTPYLSFEVYCSKGTYVRTLAEDLALKLGSLAHLRELRRTASGKFSCEYATSLEQLRTLESNLAALDNLLLPLDAGLSHLGRVDLDERQLGAICHGQSVATGSSAAGGVVRIYAPGGGVTGIGELQEGGLLVPKRLFTGLVPKNQAG